MQSSAAFSFPNRRQETWETLLERGSRTSRGWDILVVGGGITGAGILREAARRGLSAALLEQKDFAWGTSSRSSKMIHGGLRYLLSGDVKLVRASVRERDRLLSQAPGLIEPLGFLFSHYKGRFPGRHLFGGLLWVYDLFSGSRSHRYYPAPEYLFLAPHVDQRGLKGGTFYLDGVVDDARLVLRTIQEACGDGALAINYVRVQDLLIAKNRAVGVSVKDEITGKETDLFARVVVNATGVWADRLQSTRYTGPHIRPLRGSHLVLPFWKLPVSQAVTLRHPADKRPVFVFPWEGATIVGTTDLDHAQPLNNEPRISPREIDYLMDIIHYQFPSLHLEKEDILSTFAGIRPVIGGTRKRPSNEKRDHSIWEQDGMISVSGGKLTTFRLIALDVLRAAAPFLASVDEKDAFAPVFSRMHLEGSSTISPDHFLARRLQGRYGRHAIQVMECETEDDLERIPGTDTLWAEVRWAARGEAVMHLEDLLLRRTRLGILLEKGGTGSLDRIRDICREELGWDLKRWEEEVSSYKRLWETCYSVPGNKESGSSI
ncbi:MAG: glycerol-3-phosphate dehydrogenase/oxidase [Deltaproteobacteria bacterium]|nr:glycerol-3-phosphate dehydrogenase/oxidase [Deltaproteobacteria bacterium]